MNIQEVHSKEKAVSAVSFFKGEEGTVIALQILHNQQLKEHITKVPALLICVAGKVTFKNEKDVEETLLPGDYINIAPHVKHWVNGIMDSQLLLIK